MSTSSRPLDPYRGDPSAMYEYTFATCPVEFRRGEPSPEAYRQIITDHARHGWRLVQIFIPIPAVVPSRYEMIFERPRRS